VIFPLRATYYFRPLAVRAVESRVLRMVVEVAVFGLVVFWMVR
jgi:hypothetical protein